jgi:hypothetical protein
MELLVELYYKFASPLSGIYVQDKGGDLGFTVFENKGTDPAVLVYILLGLAIIIFALIYSLHRYSKWKKFKVFEDEMKSLDLNPDDENAFTGMVKRFELEEPVNVLMSARLFDEMATKEIEKVLGSAGSKSAKERFIESIYRIRTKTYHSDWLKQEEIEPKLDTLHLSTDAENEVAVN